MPKFKATVILTNDGTFHFPSYYFSPLFSLSEKGLPKKIYKKQVFNSSAYSGKVSVCDDFEGRSRC